MSEATKQKLFQYLQGHISFEEYQQHKSSLEDDDGTAGGDAQQAEGSAVSCSTSRADEETDTPMEVDDDQNTVLDYLHGKITFEEFDKYLELRDSADTETAEENVYELSEQRVSDGETEESSPSLPEQTEKDGDDHAPKKPRRRRGRIRTRLPKDLQGLMGEANLRFAHGEYEEAIKMCLEVIRLAPTAQEPFQTLGMLYEETGDKEKAMQYSLIGAHLNPRDAEEWARLAELSLELNNTKQAVTCLTKAIKNAPSNAELLWERAKLYKSLDETKRLVEDYVLLLQLVPPSDGEQYFLVSRSLAETYHLGTETGLAIECLENAFKLCPKFITSEYVNLLTELYLSQKAYETIIDILVKHCGVKLETSVEGGEVKYKSCVIPDALPIDLRVKIIIALIFLSHLELVSEISKSVFAEDVEEYGDLFLDIAEAYIENDCNSQACPILQRLVTSQKYCGAAALWLKHGECLGAVGRLVEASEAYKKVVDLVPSHYEARVSLSLVQQQLGQTEQALETLVQDDSELIVSDPCLLLHRCHLLLSHKQYDEYYKSSRKLLFGHLLKILAKKTVQSLTFFPRTYKHRKDVLRAQFGGDFDQSPVYAETSTVSTDDLWEIFVKSCQTFHTLKQFDRMVEFGTACQLIEAFMKDPVKEREAQFLTCYASMHTRKAVYAADLARVFVLDANVPNATWNFYGQAMTLGDSNRHNRFISRQIAAHPDCVPLRLLNGHCAVLTSFYKRSVHDYFSAVRMKPNDPMTNLCCGLSFLHLASQSYAAKRHDLILQAICFFNRYRELRGECQEVFYNLGRAMHQVGLKHAALFYYHKALATQPMVKEDKNFDLSKEAAYNLALIYKMSGSLEMASMITQKFLVI